MQYIAITLCHYTRVYKFQETLRQCSQYYAKDWLEVLRIDTDFVLRVL